MIYLVYRHDKGDFMRDRGDCLRQFTDHTRAKQRAKACKDADVVSLSTIVDLYASNATGQADLFRKAISGKAGITGEYVSPDGYQVYVNGQPLGAPWDSKDIETWLRVSRDTLNS